jgi:hypothetical protein
MTRAVKIPSDQSNLGASVCSTTARIISSSMRPPVMVPAPLRWMYQSTAAENHFNVIAITKNVRPNNRVKARETSACGHISQTGNQTTNTPKGQASTPEPIASGVIRA